MKINLLIIVMIIVSPDFSSAQSTRCSTMQRLDEMIHADPSIKQRMENNELQIQEWIKNSGRLSHVSEFKTDDNSASRLNGTVQMVPSICGYDNTYDTTLAAPVSLHNIINPVPNCVHGGQFITITGMIAGYVYRVSTCGSNNFDTQLSIYPAGGGQPVAYNNDWCGTQSEITFIPMINGNYDVLVDDISCVDNSLCAQFAVELIDTPGTVVTVPVVVHVVHFGEPVGTGRNISDAQVLSQIRVMNDCYRKMNADISTTPAAFRGIAGDSRIQFCLASQDANGDSTTGITRYQGSRSTYTSHQFDTQVKPVTVWDRDKYLNIWTYDDGGNSGSYAQFPGGPANTDGIVVPYIYFGDTGNVSQPFALGKTAVHEIGHWFNLYHTWGDAAGCATDDSVADTPLEDVNCPFGTCPAFPYTDACSGVYPGVNYYDQMDYSGDPCLTMFTYDQTLRMTAALYTSRLSLLTSPGCQQATVGIQLILFSKAIQIYPNPSQGIMHIHCGDINLNSDLNVYNVIGKNIIALKLTEKETEINLSDFSNGVYFISISSEKGIFNSKVLLNK